MGSGRVQNYAEKLRAVLRRSPIIERRIAALDVRNAHRAALRLADTAQTRFHRITTILFLFLTAGIFVYNLHLFSRWPPPVYENPDVFNLTSAKVSWDVHYGESDLCGQIECHLTRDHSSSDFTKRQVLPVTEFPLADYRRGQNIYYRTTVTIPSHVIKEADGSSLFFNVLFIWGHQFEIYFNERLATTGSMEMAHVPIDRNAIDPEGKLTISIKVVPKGSEYQGVANFGAVLIGERSRLSSLRYVTRDHSITYFLWLVVPRLSFAFFFAFIYLTFSRNRENYHFFAFATVVAFKVLLQSDLLAELLPPWFPRVGCMIMLDAASQVLLGMFLFSYFRRNTLASSVAFGVVLALAATFGVFSMLFFENATSLVAFRHVTTVLKICVLAIGVGLAAEAALFLFVTKRSAVRFKAAVSMLVLLAATFCLRVFEAAVEFLPVSHAFVTHSGFLSHLAEMLLLFVMAAAAAVDFGYAYKQKEASVDALKTYVGSDVASKLLGASDGVTVQTRTVTVMFTDIRSFTSIAERVPQNQLVGALNEYFETMIPVIEKHGGSVDKFIGDSIMAVWGATGDFPGGAGPALVCALEMRRALARLNESRSRRGLFPLVVGVGLHHGEAVAGPIGSAGRKEYTVIGDCVNVAARVQDLTRTFEFDIIATDSVISPHSEMCVVLPCADAKVKGKAKRLSVYRLLGVVAADGNVDCGIDAVTELVANHYRRTGSCSDLTPEELKEIGRTLWADVVAFLDQSDRDRVA